MEVSPLNRSRVYYLNLGRGFITGTVYDPVNKEVLISVEVTLTEMYGRKAGNINKTDHFGDFKFKKNRIGHHKLVIENSKQKIEIKVYTKKDTSLGDIPINFCSCEPALPV